MFPSTEKKYGRKLLVIWPHIVDGDAISLTAGLRVSIFEIIELCVAEARTCKSGAQLRMADSPNDQENTRHGSVNVRRRRFVRAASLAGPAVITLQSGHAWAVSNCQADQGFLGFSRYPEPDPLALEGQGDALSADSSRYYGESSQIEALVNLSYSC